MLALGYRKGSDSGLASNGDGLAFAATKQGSWVAVIDYPRSGAVANSLLYLALPPI